MDAQLTIRRARTEDAAALAELRVALGLEGRAADFDSAEYRERCQNFFQRALASEDVMAWIALCERRAVGIAVLELRATLPRAHSVRRPTVDGRVRSVFVYPEHRRRGIGSALVREVIAAAHTQRVDRLTLGASEMGLPLYEGLGFILRDREMIYGQQGC